MLFAVSLCGYALWVSFKDCSVELVGLLQEEQEQKRCDLLFNHFKNGLFLVEKLLHYSERQNLVYIMFPLIIRHSCHRCFI